MRKQKRIMRGTGYIVSSALLLLSMVCFVVSMDGKPIKKVWEHNTGDGYNYVYRYTDQWGGLNYWCISPTYSECSYYDWMAAYDCPCGDPVPQNNTVAYGMSLIEQEADAMGITLPTDLPTPSFVLIE